MNQPRAYFIVRPRWEDILGGIRGAGVVGCSCGASLWTPSEVRDHWQQGHFDRVINPGDEGYNNLFFGKEDK